MFYVAVITTYSIFKYDELNDLFKVIDWHLD